MKKLLTILSLFISTAALAQVPLAGYVTTIGPSDTYPVTLDSLQAGGYTTTYNYTTRNAIPAERRKISMEVRYSSNKDSTFVLSGGITNNDWVYTGIGNSIQNQNIFAQSANAWITGSYKGAAGIFTDGAGNTTTASAGSISVSTTTGGGSISPTSIGFGNSSGGFSLNNSGLTFGVGSYANKFSIINPSTSEVFSTNDLKLTGTHVYTNVVPTNSNDLVRLTDLQTLGIQNQYTAPQSGAGLWTAGNIRASGNIRADGDFAVQGLLYRVGGPWSIQADGSTVLNTLTTTSTIKIGNTSSGEVALRLQSKPNGGAYDWQFMANSMSGDTTLSWKYRGTDIVVAKPNGNIYNGGGYRYLTALDSTYSENTFVHKAGDNMTGQLNLPTIKVGTHSLNPGTGSGAFNDIGLITEAAGRSTQIFYLDSSGVAKPRWAWSRETSTNGYDLRLLRYDRSGLSTNFDIPLEYSYTTGSAKFKAPVFNTNTNLGVAGTDSLIAKKSTGEIVRLAPLTSVLGGYVPYTGASGAVNLNGQNLTNVGNFALSGSATIGAGYTGAQANRHTITDDNASATISPLGIQSKAATATASIDYYSNTGVLQSAIGYANASAPAVIAGTNYFFSSSAPWQFNLNNTEKVRINTTGIIVTQNNLITTSAAGLLITNPTAATAVSALQYSPQIKLSGTAWNTTSSGSSDTHESAFELRTASGTTTNASLNLGFRVNAGAYTYPFNVSNIGIITLGTAGRLLVGTVPSAGKVVIGTDAFSTSAAYGTMGMGFQSNAATYTSTAAAGSPASVGVNTFGIPTLTATNAQAITNASTFRIAGPPVASTNVTIANPFALDVASGNTLLSGSIMNTNTAAGTAGTDSLLVKVDASNEIRRISPTFYGAINAANTWTGNLNRFTFGIALNSGAKVNWDTSGGTNTTLGADPLVATNVAVIMPKESGTLELGTKLRLTGSGTGAATTISIAHGLTGVTSSSIAMVQPINAASAGISYVTTDSANINIVYTVAPANGTNNLSYNVSIKP